jgi:hypothetical protein
MSEDAPTKLKHFTRQVAMAPQSSIALSQGLGIGGQQSGMSSTTDVRSGDLTLTPTSLAAGTTATEKATRKARMSRVTVMDQLSRRK